MAEGNHLEISAMTNLRLATTLALASCLVTSTALARSDLIDIPVNTATAYDESSALRDVPYYMAGRSHPAIAKDLGVYRSNKRTNAFTKSDEHACSIAFLSALISLQTRAQRLGGDAVVDIKSITKHRDLESSAEFRCAVGNVVANVALTGRVVKFSK
jgi:uncharacterized protein YbjQ (UPF0145 family)